MFYSLIENKSYCLFIILIAKLTQYIIVSILLSNYVFAAQFYHQQ